MLVQKRENPSSIRSKNAMAEALLKLMLYRPYPEITVSHLTERAHLSRQAFYTNFQKMDDILVYLLHGLYKRYLDKLSEGLPRPDQLLIDYFLYWGESRDFLGLLFRQDLGYIFQNCNRAFFLEDTDILNGLFTCEDWQLPYVKASLAGVTYELLYMWLTRDQGLSVDVLSSLTRNLLAGAIFARAE